MPAVTVMAAVGAKRRGSAGSGSGSGDGACKRSVGGIRCEQARAKQERQGSATVGSGSVWCKRWLRRWLRRLRAAARVTQKKTGEGRIWCERKANPSPLFISLTRQPKSHFPLNFAVIANLAKPASPPALRNF